MYIVKNKNRKFKYYNNGIKTIKVFEGMEVPDGFIPGTTWKQKAWNSGLTKEDPRVKANMDKCHQTRKENNNYKAWNQGLTKETDERVRLNSEHTKQTIKEKYNVDNIKQLIVKDPEYKVWNKGLTKDTDQRVKQISDSLQGRMAWNKGLKIGNHWTEESFFKRYLTQLNNGTLGKNKDTKAEKEYYNYLLTLYDESDIIRQYYDKERYPFKCDFYIKSKDLFIEVHGNWTHGGMPYIKGNEICENQLNEWIEKSKNSNYYKNAIYTWTDLDVRKLNTFKSNKLNYEIIYL